MKQYGLKFTCLMALVIALCCSFAMNAEAETQQAIFPFYGEVTITQGYGEGMVSHMPKDCRAIDVTFYGRAHAPFDMVLKYKRDPNDETQDGQVIFQSKDEVALPNGGTSYVLVLFCHDSDITDIKKEYGQGEEFYDMGTAYAYSAHVHFECALGKWNDLGWYENMEVPGDMQHYTGDYVTQTTYLKNAVDPEKVFYLNSGTKLNYDKTDLPGYTYDEDFEKAHKDRWKTISDPEQSITAKQSPTVSGLTTTSAQLNNTVTFTSDLSVNVCPVLQYATCFIGTDKNAVNGATSSSHPNTYVCSSSYPQPVESISTETSETQKYEFSFPTADFMNGSERPSLQKGATWYYRWEITAGGKTYSSGNAKAFQVTGWYDLAATKITNTDALLEGYVKYDLSSMLIRGGCFLSTSQADVSNATPDNHSNVLYVTDPASTFADKNNGYSDTSDYRYTRLYYTAQGSQSGSLGFETALKPGTTYYYKFYSIRPIDGNLGNLEVIYSDVRSFTTTGAAAAKYQLTISASEGGEIVNGIPGIYSENATVSMTAKAKTGYSFLKWETTAGTFTNPYDPTTLFAMTSSDAAVTARFVPDSASVTLTPKTTDFGQVNQASLLVYKRIVVTNNGSRAVTLVPKSGRSFTFEDQKAFLLEPGESDDLYVYASTLTPGVYSETLNLETPEGRVVDSLDFSIEVTRAPSGVSFLTIEPFKYSDFGTWYVGSEPLAARTFTVLYVGEGSVQLKQPVVESAYFEVGALSKTTLNSNETATFTIRPKSNIPLGYHTASVEIKGTTDDIGEISCSQAASIHVKQGAVAASPVRLDFATLPADYTAPPAAQTVTITNTGNMLLDLDMSKVASSYFNITAVDNPEWMGKRQILEGGSIQFSVQPKTGLPVGTYNETFRLPLTVENGTLAVTIPLSFTVGKGVDSGIDLNLKNLDFGAVEPYLNMTPPNAQTLRVTNTSEHELVLAKPTATYFTVTASSYTVASKGSIQLEVQPKQGLAPGKYEEEIPLMIVSAVASQDSGNLRAGSSPSFFFKASYEVLPYQLVSGNNAQCVVGGEEDIEVVCNGDPNQLTQFLFAGLDITAKVKIESVQGRTKVTIPAEVLNRFPVGIYTLTFVYRDGGSVEAKLCRATIHIGQMAKKRREAWELIWYS